MKTSLPAVLLSCTGTILLFQSCAPSPRPSSCIAYAEAMSSYMDGNEKQALLILKKLVDDSPGFTEASYLYGRVLFYSEQYSAAANCLEQTLELTADNNINLDSAKILIRSYLILNKPGKAEEVLEQVLPYSSEDPELLYLKARCRITQNNPGEALALLTAACTIMERQIEIPLELASLYSRYGLYTEAFKVVDRYDHILKEDHPLKASVRRLKSEYQEKKKTRP